MPKLISLDWIDTPGEIWQRGWSPNNQSEWQIFLRLINNSEGIMLVLPPYREILKSNINLHEFITRQQWVNRFERWVEFITQYCSQVRHLAICLNKADLFCHIDQEESKVAYASQLTKMDWLDRHQYVYQEYFEPLNTQLQEIHYNIYGLSISCFLTSIKSRPLLELPWIYFATYLIEP